MAKVADNLITLGLALLGFVLMLTPLALWVAWTDMVLLIVLAAGVAAGVLYCVLVRFEKPASPGQGERGDPVRDERLPDHAMDELQTLHPFIYHNGPHGGPKFHGVMRHLKRYLNRRPD